MTSHWQHEISLGGKLANTTVKSFFSLDKHTRGLGFKLLQPFGEGKTTTTVSYCSQIGLLCFPLNICWLFCCFPVIGPSDAVQLLPPFIVTQMPTGPIVVGGLSPPMYILSSIRIACHHVLLRMLLMISFGFPL